MKEKSNEPKDLSTLARENWNILQRFKDRAEHPHLGDEATLKMAAEQYDEQAELYKKRSKGSVSERLRVVFHEKADQYTDISKEIWKALYFSVIKRKLSEH